MIDNLDNVIQHFFSTDELNDLARETMFVQREAKIDGSTFFNLIVFNSESLKFQSLNDLTTSLKDENGIDISKQSLHDRFNNYALLFLKEALEMLLQKQLSIEPIEYFNSFNRILVKDSTCFQIDESLEQYYPGSGGSSSKASVRIQFEYDLLSGKINDLSINAFNVQDAKDSIATIELTQKGDLIIRDLAYMNIEILQAIQNIEALFLCRANPNAYVFQKNIDGNYEKIDFIKLHQYMRDNDIHCLEIEAYIGCKEKFKTRLIVYLLPDEIYAKRIRDAKKNNNKQLNKERKAKLGLNLYITNASSEQIPMKNVWNYYKLRWQIELIFKIWKSICHIEKVKKVKKHRLECYIYSKLILIVLCWQILWKTARNLFITEGKNLSFFKAAKTLIYKKITELKEIFILKKGSINEFMNKFYGLSRVKHLLEKRAKKPTSMEILLTCLKG